MNRFPENATIAQLYGPAMEITNPQEAAEYLSALIHYNMTVSGNSLQEATRIELSNLGYYAGYYDHATRIQVERLFHTTHPFFGAAVNGEPTMEEALNKGIELGKKMKERSM
jgi:hypothetical protein